MHATDNIYPTQQWEEHPHSDNLVLKGGLTVIEYFSAMAMQGFLHSADINKERQDYFYPKLAHDSVRAAKALINELNNEAHERTNNDSGRKA